MLGEGGVIRGDEREGLKFIGDWGVNGGIVRIREGQKGRQE